jgi:hypothetical protein
VRLPVALASTLLVAATVAGCGPRAPQVAGLPERVDFNFDVRPILSDRCFACHGPDDRARKAGLRLDRRENATAELPSGSRAIVPGSARRSALVDRILSEDPSFAMPPAESHLALDERERALLVRWVEQGAEWKPHWAFVPPRKPPQPAVKDGSWPRNDVDRFVLARLEASGMRPSPEADRETLLRRVTLDLTGLPPLPDEIDAFLADRAPQAYERVVDRLLSSTAYAEHRAADWMDVARFADSHGYQDDGMRDVSPWRDWVISAFDRNLRFDDFVTWQLAGDLLPNATAEQRIATGFNRNHMQSQEGGIVPEEYRTAYVADRVDTLGRAFLGVSLECARCHDHKYDPISQKDYYRLFAVFNSVNEAGQIPYSGVPSPTEIVMDAGSSAQLDTIRSRVLAFEADARPDNPAYDAGFRAWLAKGAPSAAQLAQPPGEIVHLPLGPGERALAPREKGKVKAAGAKPKRVLRFANVADPRRPAVLGGDQDKEPKVIDGPVGRALTLVGDSDVGLPEGVAFFERNEPFSLALWFRLEKKGASGPLVTRSGGLFNGNRGYELIVRPDGTLTAGLHHVFPDNSIEIETVSALAPGEWRHLALAYDGSSRAAGLRLFLDGRPAVTRVRVDNLRRSILNDGKGGSWGDRPGLKIGRRHEETLADLSVDELRVWDRQLSGLEAAAVARRPGTAEPAPRSRTPSSPDLAALREHYLLRVDPAFAATRKALTAVRGEENALLTARPEVMTMRELPAPRPTFVLARGAYDAPTERVEPGTPEVMGPQPKTARADRLALARWLVDPRHPLFSRVIVNRYWAQLFGRGIVATPADFGSQGRLPTHPELLDWLAARFAETGYDLKALQRLIVLSATYRQSSVADAPARERDPDNEWLARGPSRRLTAEQIRDAVLAASGLLVRKVGGPSVYPYQPPGLWEELATRNATSYVVGKGDDLYRRSLYTVWKRTSPPPAPVSFDSAERLFCTVKRQRTSTPLQALALQNDTQQLEAARVLAEWMAREGGASAEQRVAAGFRRLTGRRPAPEETRVLLELYRQERARFEASPDVARAALSVGQRRVDASLPAAETAALAVVASTVMNLDATVFSR